MTTVRKLTPLGIAQFTEYLKRIASGEIIDPPFHLLAAADSSEALLGSASIDAVALETKHAAAKYFNVQLASLDKSEVENNVGLWTWLSLFFFDRVCPATANGARKPGEIVRHVLSEHRQRYYRHLLAGPCRLLQMYGDRARLFLYNPLTEHGDFSEQLASRTQFISNRSLTHIIQHPV